MDKLTLIKRTQTDVVNKRFKYLCQRGNKQNKFGFHGQLLDIHFQKGIQLDQQYQ